MPFYNSMALRLPPPSELTKEELLPYYREYLRRIKPATPNAPIVEPCRVCGELLNARQRRRACPKCGKHQTRQKSAQRTTQ